MKKILFWAMIALSINIASAQYGEATEIPFRVRGGMITISAQVNGQMKELIVDTGATHSFVFLNQTKRLNVRIKSAGVTTHGVGGTAETFATSDAKIYFRGQYIGKITRALDLKGIKFTSRFVGVLGFDFLSQGWVIDYTTQKLTKI